MAMPTKCRYIKQLKFNKYLKMKKLVKWLFGTRTKQCNINDVSVAVASDMKDNKIMLLEEDLWCVHKYLDDLELPRNDKDGKEYSIVGRIKRLEERYLKQMSELEAMYLSGNCT